MSAETPVLASAAAIDHPALEFAEPVTSPVRATDCAEANSVADVALPLNVVADTVDVDGLILMPEANMPVLAPRFAEAFAVATARIGYAAFSVDTFCVISVSVLPEAGRVTVMLDAEVMRPLASTVNFGTVNVPE